jgi:polar amino acid transport system substrate-binding protein
MKNKLLVLVVLLILSSSLIQAKEYKVSIKEIPGVSDMFVKIIKTVIEATGNTADIEVVSPAKSEYMIIEKKVDLEYPSIFIPKLKKGVDLKYDFASVTLNKIPFVFYTNKNKTLDVDAVRKDNQTKFKIETELSICNKIDYNFIPTTNVEGSFKKLANGIIDGIIAVQSTGDLYLKKSGLKNIKRQLWNEYDWTFSLQKGGKGGEVDKMLIDGINILKKNGKYDSLLDNVKYIEWQP